MGKQRIPRPKSDVPRRAWNKARVRARITDRRQAHRQIREIEQRVAAAQETTDANQ